MHEPATFSLFARKLPEARGFLAAAGVEACLDFLEEFRFEAHDLAYLRDSLGFSHADTEAFRRLRFNGDVWAVPEGRVVLADEPILEVTGSIAEAQLVETFLLNQVTFQTAIASKAARCVLAAQGSDLVDFGFRRTQGIEAGLAAARLSAIVGFAATSNVEAARRYGLAASGTMAHSYIEAFRGEAEAFRAFATDFPGRTTFLVDTYDTMSGVRHAIAVIEQLGLRDGLGIRLDSGDLLDLSRRARRLLDAAGLQRVRIIASGGLDEFAIDELVLAGAPIDAFGVGTKMGVSADHPYLDTAYKLVWYGDRPMMKLSPRKVTAPGLKQVFRRRQGFGDRLGLREEPAPEGWEPVLERVMIGGRRTRRPSTIAAARLRFQADLARLPEEAKRITSPLPPPVRRTEALRRLAATTSQSVLKEAV